MKKIIAMGITAILLGGCSTAKHAMDQTIYGHPESYDYNNKNIKPAQSDDLLVSADEWIRRNMW